MKKIIFLSFLFIPVSLFSLTLYEEIAVGYYDDLGVTLGIRLDDFGSNVPFYIQSRIGATYQFDPGNAEDARQIFINDNQGGNIQEYGQSFLFALDFGWKVYQKKSLAIEMSASGLMNHYNAHFAFIGNNEAFTVSTTALGVGLGCGLRIGLPESRTSFILKGGVEYLFPSRIDAHGTYYYTPDNSDDNPRNDFSYNDAKESINQPHFRPYVQLAVVFPISK